MKYCTEKAAAIYNWPIQLPEHVSVRPKITQPTIVQLREEIAIKMK